MNEWGKALNSYLGTFLMEVVLMERRRREERTEDFAPQGTGGHA